MLILVNKVKFLFFIFFYFQILNFQNAIPDIDCLPFTLEEPDKDCLPF